ncbi:hypothetical protein AWZ03_002885 [Drosophila navojoa]|uniref:GPI ethanolamine phosphate transferase 1 n=2 Tax=Drosophila navojoa TaxID=7232 RepID=A0A484BS37_DRONA|nr:GPI ethanolamine phosphate transferase 1 isoform X1 [Drosophila navojoa]TDG50581.1 hypothetical protein AWZ03_002885 [Drosophila navojoa]
MWIIYALVVHILLLGSIFVIYFRSPVIEGLEPQPRLKGEPPADRLVLIVTDGLRAESFFADNCNHVPHLREIFVNEGIVGISRTRVPTESRPGHIALIAGLYEDPSAVTRGWKENPIEFDTLFNRSDHTYAWGAHDVLHIFEKLADSGRPMYFDSYNHDLDFSGGMTYKQDEWVFERVRLLLNRKQEELRKAKRVVFFLHLLGLDTAGHVHKPGTRLFLENLNYTEHEIWKIYKEFEKTFPDQRTAYLLTSDHGMTNSGSHGAGDQYETDTPFMLWGAGVAHSVYAGITFEANDEGLALPLREVEQAQLTPLMSALIGLPPPMNNFGRLPLGFLGTDAKYEAMAARANALQLLAQYVRLQKQHMRGLFAPVLNSFHELTSERIAEYVGYISTSFKLNQFDESLANSAVVMQLALEGIDYYQGYYCNVMLLSTTATILGWMFYLYRLLTQDAEPQKMDSHKNDHTSKITVCLWIAVALLIGFVVVQRVPLAVSFYLLLPLPVWIFALRQVPSSNEDLINLPAYNQPAVATPTKASIMQLLLLIGCAELLVFTFFERRLISLCFVAFALYSNWDTFKTKRSFYLWLLLVAALACFPLVPPSVGYQNCSLLLAGILLLLFRQFLSRVQDNFKWHGRWCNTAILINTAVCVHLRNQQTAAPLPLNILSWLYLAYAFASILLSKETALEVRLQHICYNLGTLYTMMCTSYESLFVQLLAIELTTSLAEQRAQVEPLQHQQKSLQSSLRIAFTLILYTFFSLFGSGNIASISSFDPNISRCFLSHFAPFVIMSLVLLKLLLPIVTNISIVYTYSEYARLHERQIFICLLLICDVMGLNFLFLVRNTGSWMEIGSSISHFVIMEVTTLVLVLLAYVSKLLLQLTCSDRVLSKRN